MQCETMRLQRPSGRTGLSLFVLLLLSYSRHVSGFTARPAFLSTKTGSAFYLAAKDTTGGNGEPISGSKDSVIEALKSSEEEYFPNAEFFDYVLDQHRPLGCTVEESLAHPTEKHVFVTKVVEGGFAKEAGLEVGDVIVALSGIFDDLSSVLGTGIEQVQSLVKGRPEFEPLSIRVARGTNVLELHESAVVDLCILPGAGEKEIEDCLNTIMNHGYEDIDEDESDEFDCDGEAECLLDDMHNMWDEDHPVPLNSGTSEEEVEEVQEEKIAPWSSRSSPSGTYVRDPATGEMKNIG